MTNELSQLRGLTPEAFAALGAPGLAYVKPVKIDGNFAFAVHGADGRELAVFQDRETAIVVALQHEMQPVSVH
ncbi:MAG: DUF1150 family protein [Alphaproteobacteria bacterium]|nr:DUF1150 family protein [Alphaproteobacteria bacterium]